MIKMPASIFNDVIGPVMRGPSSSHTAASYRIGLAARQSVGNAPYRAVVDFDVNGSLAAIHEGQGTDMGLICGFLGKDITEDGVDRYRDLARENGLDVEFRVLDYGAVHPNNYRMEIFGSQKRRLIEGVSVGGGMIEIQKIDGCGVSIRGDFYEVLAFFKEEAYAAFGQIKILFAPDFAYASKGEKETLLSLKFSKEQDERALETALFDAGAKDVVFIKPFLPVLSRANCRVPFSSAQEALSYGEGKNLSAAKLAALYEAERGGITEEEAFQKMLSIVNVMESALKNGLAGTEYKDRILGRQSHLIDDAAKRGALLPCGALNDVIKSITAIMETKSAMGVIVAAPTAGSCGCLPGTLLGMCNALGKTKKEITEAMLAAGLIGLFIAENATFAAEVGGCQVECGAGSAMAAAGLVQLAGGSARQAMDAASMALQNVTGLACDPVAERAEVPCLGKNVMCGANAITAANMALAGFDKVIPLDETIAAVYDVGQKLPAELRCTSGGLGKTKTALEISRRLAAAQKCRL